MPEKFGVENLKKLVALGLEMGNVADRIVQGSGASKWLAMVDLGDELLALTGVQWNQVGDEYKDLSEPEKAQLMAFAKEKFDIADDKLEAVIESSLGLVMKMEGVVKEAITLYKSATAEKVQATT